MGLALQIALGIILAIVFILFGIWAFYRLIDLKDFIVDNFLIIGGILFFIICGAFIYNFDSHNDTGGYIFWGIFVTISILAWRNRA